MDGTISDLLSQSRVSFLLSMEEVAIDTVDD